MDYRDRYKEYTNVLIGKQEIDQLSIAFSGETDNNKYLRYASEDDKYWYINITKQILVPNPYNWLNNEKPPIHIGSLLYSIYMFKEKDLVILKSSVILPNSRSANKSIFNNCSSFFTRALRQKNYKKFGFTKERSIMACPITWNTGKFEIRNIKILIDDTKTSDDLAELLISIDKWNNYVRMSDIAFWDNFDSIKQNVSFQF